MGLGFRGLNVLRVSQSAFTRDYALCSASHDIYTVDEAQPRVECVVVGGTRILDTGSFGTSNGWELCEMTLVLTHLLHSGCSRPLEEP